jgi:hypothetical protein
VGFFERWSNRAASAAGADGLVVPAGHRVDVHRARAKPGILRSSGGVWLAHLGAGNDLQQETLDRLLDEVALRVSGPRPPVLFASAPGPVSQLMTPAVPPHRALPGHLVWILDAAALAGASDAPLLTQRLLRSLYVSSCAAMPQTVFASSDDGAPARAVVTLIRELGVAVRALVASDQAVLVDVQRPDGMTICALLGACIEQPASVGAWARELNIEKDQAAADPERLAELEERERQKLEERLTPASGVRRVAAVEYAPRLRRLLLAVAGDGSPANRKALYDELLVREIPLLLMVDPITREAWLRTWCGGVQALPVYADQATLRASARDLGLSSKRFVIAEMRPAELLAWAAAKSRAVALCVFGEANDPAYVFIQAEQVRALVQGA